MRAFLRKFRFVLPVLLLVALIGLFVAVERNLEESLHKFENVLRDPAPRLAYQLQESFWSFQGEVDELRADDVPPERVALLEAKLDLVKQKSEALEAFFAKSRMNAHGHEDHLFMLQSVLRHLGRIEGNLKNASGFSSEFLDIFRGETSYVNHLISEFNNRVNETNQKTADKAYMNNLAERQRHILLLVMIHVTAFILFGAIYINVKSLRRNAKIAERAEQYSALFAASLQSASVGILIRNMQAADQPIVYVNKAFTEITGYDYESVADKKLGFLFGWYTDAESVKTWREIIGKGQGGTFTLQLYRKDGSTFWGEWRLTPLKDQKGKLTHYVSIITDITDLRQTQEALLLAKEQAEKASVVKTNFLATMSHEIRTPMNGLLGVLDLLRDTQLAQEQRKLLDLALSSSCALQEIINDILDYSKIEAGKIKLTLAPFELRALLRDAIDLVRPLALSKGLELKLEVEDAIVDGFVSDSGRIRQVILNLLTNAIKFTDQGSVTLGVKALLTQETPSGTEFLLRFEVQDTGIGIGSSDQDKLFKEFSQIESDTTRKFGGTGLGLAISRRLVNMMRGEIGVDSKLGVGSKFWFMIPLAVDVKTQETGYQLAASIRVEAKAIAKKDARVLFVEDNETNRLVTSRYLEKTGYAFDCATTGEEAVQKALSGSFSIILMDISMPGMDGFEATRQIRALGGWAAQVPIIALTAHVMEGMREKCLAAGMNDHLGKPLSYETLTRKIEQWLGTTDYSTQVLAGEHNKAADQPSFDSNTLKRLVDDLGEAAMMRITQAFLDGLERQATALKPNGPLPDMALIEHTAHTLKGSGVTCGLVGFAGLMSRIEQAAKDKNEPLVDMLLKEVEPATMRAKQELCACREKYQGYASQ